MNRMLIINMILFGAFGCVIGRKITEWQYWGGLAILIGVHINSSLR
jgi:hypothetical protein